MYKAVNLALEKQWRQDPGLTLHTFTSGDTETWQRMGQRTALKNKALPHPVPLKEGGIESINKTTVVNNDNKFIPLLTQEQSFLANSSMISFQNWRMCSQREGGGWCWCRAWCGGGRKQGVKRPFHSPGRGSLAAGALSAALIPLLACHSGENMCSSSETCLSTSLWQEPGDREDSLKESYNYIK